MTSGEIVDYTCTNLKSFTDQVLGSVRDFSDAQMNQPPSPNVWSVAQVLEHMVLGNEPYLGIFSAQIPSAPQGDDSKEAKHTWVGKLIMKAAGPSGNAPVNGKMMPKSTPIDRSVLESWERQNHAIIEFAKASRGKCLDEVRFKNPFIGIVTMNLADAFMILTLHTDRHAHQILERAAIVRGSSSQS